MTDLTTETAPCPRCHAHHEVIFRAKQGKLYWFSWDRESSSWDLFDGPVMDAPIDGDGLVCRSCNSFFSLKEYSEELSAHYGSATAQSLDERSEE